MKRIERLLSQMVSTTYLNDISRTLILVTVVLYLVYVSLLAFENNALWMFLRFGCMALIFMGFAFILSWGANLLIGTPKLFSFSVLFSMPLLILITEKSLILSPFLFFLIGLGATLIYILRKHRFKRYTSKRKTLTFVGAISFLMCCYLLILGFTVKGFDLGVQRNAALLSHTNVSQIHAEPPMHKGPFKVLKLTYGSGNDKHRQAYGAQAHIKTIPIDGSRFVGNWTGIGGWWRTKYWGFNDKELPLNARVWYPDSKDTFPLVLIVHGDHPMQDYSDDGYAYLGELLASRGYIVASVDQNFLNVLWSYTSGALFDENDARAILLLEHLKLWHHWNEDQSSAFYNKVDTEHIALIGHSRGGEAIAHASLFNKLTSYPDDTSVPFDYHYNIESLVAIAAVDGQYKPAKKNTQLEHVNYLAIHGTYDGEVKHFMGLSQFNRIKLKDSAYRFKSALYIHGANHGQFNSTWGNKDSFSPFSGLLNVKPLLSEEDQQNITKVYIGAFLDATLKNKRSYLPLFRDYRSAKGWLPNTIYLSKFEDSNVQHLCTFNGGDDDLTTTSGKHGITGHNLLVWEEWHKKILIAWDNKEDPDHNTNPLLKIAVPTNSIHTDSTSVFIFSAVQMNKNNQPFQYVESFAKQTDGLIDFSIVMEDNTGQQIRFLLSDFSYLQEPLDVAIMKVDILKNTIDSKRMLQTFSFPLQAITTKNKNFNASAIRAIYFVFDKTRTGKIMIDDIGFTRDLSL